MKNVEFTLELELEGAPHAVVDVLGTAFEGFIHGLRRGWCITDARGDDWLVVVPDSPAFRVCSPVLGGERARVLRLLLDAIRTTGVRVVHLKAEIAIREAERGELDAVAARLEEMCR